jgi:hypothetical protein
LKSGRIRFPIRSCYPQVALRGREAHVMAVGDIVEPNAEWRKAKYEKFNRGWDYVFRRLFYVWTPDITRRDFSQAIEIENVEPTAGHILNLDMRLGPDRTAHLLYRKRTVEHEFMRDRFFPGVAIRTSLESVTVVGGKVTARETIIEGGEGIDGPVPYYARWHHDSADRPYLLYSCDVPDGEGAKRREMRLAPMLLPGPAYWTLVPLEHQFGTFFTNTVRGGSAGSDFIDIYGQGGDNELRYARVRMK